MHWDETRKAEAIDLLTKAWFDSDVFFIRKCCIFAEKDIFIGLSKVRHVMPHLDAHSIQERND